MTHLSKLAAKYHNLARRAKSLSSELDIWVESASANSTLEKNFSQIEALDYFMKDLLELLQRDLITLDSAGNTDTFLAQSLNLTENLIKAHSIWDFFRDRLELRFVPQFQPLLLVADLISHDCYTTITDRAKALRIIPAQGFREYPLIGLIAEFSPATWPRGRRPPALESHQLPVPIIDLPWDHLTNPWELITIAHEVGHDVDQDLGKLTPALEPAVVNQLNNVKTPRGRVVQWERWTSEILADLVGILLTGPAFVRTLAGLLTLPRRYVRFIKPDAQHPPHYLRLFINTALLCRLGLSQSAADLETEWQALYGAPGDEFGPYLPDVEPVITTFLDTPLTALQDQDDQPHSLGELVTFTPDDQARIQEVATRLARGASPGRLPIRHIVSASQLAFEQVAGTAHTERLENLAEQTRQTVISFARPGQLAGVASHRTRRHLNNLVRALLERPLDDFDIHGPIVKE